MLKPVINTMPAIQIPVKTEGRAGGAARLTETEKSCRKYSVAATVL